METFGIVGVEHLSISTHPRRCNEPPIVVVCLVLVKALRMLRRNRRRTCHPVLFNPIWESRHLTVGGQTVVLILRPPHGAIAVQRLPVSSGVGGLVAYLTVVSFSKLAFSKPSFSDMLVTPPSRRPESAPVTKMLETVVRRSSIRHQPSEKQPISGSDKD